MGLVKAWLPLLRTIQPDQARTNVIHKFSATRPRKVNRSLKSDRKLTAAAVFAFHLRGFAHQPPAGDQTYLGYG